MNLKTINQQLEFLLNPFILITYVGILKIKKELYIDMEILFTVINVIVLLVFLIMLNIMARKHVSFPKRVFTALAIGIVFGIVLHLIYGAESKTLEQSTDWFSIVGDGYVALLQMIVMPLIFISIVAAFSKIQIGEKFAKIGSYIFMFLIGTVAIAAIVGILRFDLWFRCIVY